MFQASSYLVLILLLLNGVVRAQSVVYVSPSGSGLGNGSTWLNALAADLLPKRLINAQPGTQFWLTGGIYKPIATNDRYASFSIASGVQVYGGFVGSESSPNDRPTTQPSSTTFSGNIGSLSDSTDNSYHVVRFDNVNDKTVLDRIVITGGYANGPLMNGSIAHSYGAGAYNNAQYSGLNSSPTIRDCYFINNKSNYYGGAIFNGGALAAESSLTLLNCTFINNSGYGGGAIFNESSVSGRMKFQATSCKFASNKAVYNGGAVGNSSRNSSTSNVVFKYCTFSNNTSSYGQGGGLSNGSVDKSNLNVDITNCLFFDNKSYYEGSAIVNGTTEATLSVRVASTTFSRNILIDGVGPTFYSSSFRPDQILSSTVVNSIVWNNGGGITDGKNAATTVTYSDVQDRAENVASETGNRNVDPQFIDPNTENYQLSGTSPVIDIGDPATTTESSTDLAGEKRIAGRRIDMGAFEFQYSSCTGGITTIRDGLWNDPAVWSCGRLPTGDDVVTVRHLISLPQNYSGMTKTIKFDGGTLLYQTGAGLSLN